jgi:DNA-binding transcriptional ArsR family regulator
VIADVDIASVAVLFGDAARARMLQALADGRALPAGELARLAGVTASTASQHLARLSEGKLVDVERAGRHRYYRLANVDVARAIEAISAIAPAVRPRTLREASIGEALTSARTCYDHLAGRLGVEITNALVERRAIEDAGDTFILGPSAEEVLASLGIEALPNRRPSALRCIDWSERRPHVAGGIGAAICARAFAAGWIEHLPTSRAVRVTPAGHDAFETLAVANAIRRPS